MYKNKIIMLYLTVVINIVIEMLGFKYLDIISNYISIIASVFPSLVCYLCLIFIHYQKRIVNVIEHTTDEEKRNYKSYILHFTMVEGMLSINILYVSIKTLTMVFTPFTLIAVITVYFLFVRILIKTDRKEINELINNNDF